MINTKDLKLSKLVRKSITVTPNATLTKTRDILLKNKIKRVVIVDKGKPIGIITEKDIARKIYKLGSRTITSIKAKEFRPRKLFVLTKDNSVQECAKLMKKHRINSVLIINQKNGLLDGIITKTDLVTIFLTSNNFSSSPIIVSDIMTKKVITVAPNDPILFVETLLLKYGISRIIVKRDQKPIGIITFRDFVPAKIPQWIAESADPKEVQEYKFEKGLREETYSNPLSYLFPFNAIDIMTSNPVTINNDDDVKSAILLMIKYNIGGLPVVKKSKLVGIITKSDIVRILAQ